LSRVITTKATKSIETNGGVRKSHNTIANRLSKLADLGKVERWDQNVTYFVIIPAFVQGGECGRSPFRIRESTSRWR